MNATESCAECGAFRVDSTVARVSLNSTLTSKLIER